MQTFEPKEAWTVNFGGRNKKYKQKEAAGRSFLLN